MRPHFSFTFFVDNVFLNGYSNIHKNTFIQLQTGVKKMKVKFEKGLHNSVCSKFNKDSKKLSLLFSWHENSWSMLFMVKIIFFRRETNVNIVVKCYKKGTF